MRVALVDPSLFTLPYDSALAGGLQAAGHEVVLFGRRRGRDDSATNGVKLDESFYRVATASAITALPKPLRLGVKGLDHAFSMASFGRRIGRWRPDVIHFQWLALPVLDRWFLPRLRRIAPMVLTMHDSNPFNGDPAASVQRLGMRESLACFDRIIVHTEQGCARLAGQGFDEARVTVMPHGLLGIPDKTIETADAMNGRLTFLLFGKLKPYKGADLLIEAFGRLPAELRHRACVRIVGKPYMDLAPLHALAERLGIAAEVKIEPRFVGDDEIGSLFAPGVIAMFPYREIEASGVLSLAIAYGRPILATRLGGFAEQIEDNLHGSLVAPENPVELSEAMVRFIADRSFGAACARNVSGLAARIPGWDAIAKRTAELYQAAGVACR
jgi:glycosyltransferase involved in cell wall biosynthesis